MSRTEYKYEVSFTGTFERTETDADTFLSYVDDFERDCFNKLGAVFTVTDWNIERGNVDPDDLCSCGDPECGAEYAVKGSFKLEKPVYAFTARAAEMEVEGLFREVLDGQDWCRGLDGFALNG